ncbi:MAG: IS5 family transposase, partial [Pseudomonadota bacterium]
MPFKFHEPHRDKILRARYKVTNWPEYDRGLVQRGDLRFWISEDALAAWAAPRRTTRGGQARFSNLAIETVLMLATVYRLQLRQAEGFTRSILALMGLDLAVPDHTTLARRRRTVAIEMNAPGRTAPVDLVLDSTGLKFYGPGEWDRLKHGEKRRAWSKLHIAVDAGTSEILAHALTDSDTSDAAIAGPLVAKAGGR